VTQTFAEAYALTKGLPSGPQQFDDIGWWALAWARGYQVTNNSVYLNKSLELFNFIATNGWADDACGGGVWWGPTKVYKNAIPNELFLRQASELCALSHNASVLAWALLEWNWFSQCGMIASNHLINDGLNINSANRSSCSNNGGTTWTYNQGVVLGGLVSLAESSSDAYALELLTAADAIATAATTILVDSNGVLAEPCESSNNCDNDQEIFKGIFSRHLWYFASSPLTLRLLGQSTVQRYANFFQVNAAAATKLYGTGEWGLNWDSNTQRVFSAATQSAALDLLIAASSFSR